MLQKDLFKCFTDLKMYCTLLENTLFENVLHMISVGSFIISMEHFVDAKKVLIVLVDGEGTGNVYQPAQQLKNIGVDIYTVGVSSRVDKARLEAMASHPVEEHVIVLETVEEYPTSALEIASRIRNGMEHILCDK